VAFVRVSRDKRGYEHIYLIDATARRGKASRPRVLYWFRTPPGVMVGREPFDESVRRALEAQYPDVTFDWEKLRKTAIPAPDVEPWRERRRVERAAKQARQAGEREDNDARQPPDFPQGSPQGDADSLRAALQPAGDLEADVLTDSPDLDLMPGVAREFQSVEPLERLDQEPLESPEPVEPLEPLEEPLEPLELLERLESLDGDNDLEPVAGLGKVAADSVMIQATPSGITPPQTEQHRRRRRRGGRRRRQSSGPEGTSSSTPSKLPKEDEPTG